MTLQRVFIAIVFCIAIAGCTSQHRFASSFAKRRYNKGFYVETPGHVITQNFTRITSVPVKSIMPEVQVANDIDNELRPIPAVQIASKASKISVATNSFQAKVDTTKTHPSGGGAGADKPKSPNNSRAVILLLCCVGAIVLTLIFAMLLFASSAALTVIAYAGAALSIALDVFAMFFAIRAISINEYDTGASKLILILNGIILVTALIRLIRNA